MAASSESEGRPDPAGHISGHGRTSESTRLATIVLAAGEGTRMKSARAKVLHGFAGRSMLGHVLAAVAPLRADVTVVVVGHEREQVSAHLHEIDPSAVAVVQAEQRGTGHAVRVALAELDALGTGVGTVLVLPGDAPLLRDETLQSLLAQHHESGAAASLLSSKLADPSGYGRVLRAADGAVQRVVEHKDADEVERAVDEVSALVYAFDAALLREAVLHLRTDNAQGEQYLPDVIGWLRSGEHTVHAVIAPASETAGVNDRVQLAAAARTYNDRVLDGHMRAGVTVLDPASTWIEADVQIEPDTVLLPGVHLCAGTRIAANATIGPDCTLRATTVGAGTTIQRSVTDTVTIGAGCTVGPFAYLRGQAELAHDVKVGTFVEVKNSTIGPASKVPHLSYVGDATIGSRTNIGASTIFANYDGVRKNRSEVGDDVRIGSDTTLVAPVRVGDRAYTGAGTVVRADVPADALALSMGPQRSIADWARNRSSPAPSVHAIRTSSDSSDPSQSDAQQLHSTTANTAEEQG